MISENSHTNIGETEIITQDSLITQVLEFLDEHLTQFPYEFNLMTANENVESEDDISQQLCDYLQRKTYRIGIFMFHFQRKYFKSKRSSDFGILTVAHESSSGLSNAFFVIEAKRLPTGSGERKKEYVEGNLGGIERYKRGHHGKGLPQSAMIGYIQKETCLLWHSEINKWINELIANNSDITIEWNNQDLLIHSADFNKTKKYNSTNTRIVNSIKDTIILWHYLIELN